MKETKSSRVRQGMFFQCVISQFLVVDLNTNDTQVRKSDRGDQHVEAESVTKDFGTIGKKGGTTFKGSC